MISTVLHCLCCSVSAKPSDLYLMGWTHQCFDAPVLWECFKESRCFCPRLIMVIRSIHINKVALKVCIYNVLFRALLLDIIETYIGPGR